MSDKKGEQTILLSNANNKGTAVEIGFRGDGSITIRSNGPVSVLSPDITLDAGEKGELTMHAKNITLVAESNVTVGAKKELALQAKDVALEASNNWQAQVGSNLTLKAGGQAKLSSADTDVL